MSFRLNRTQTFLFGLLTMAGSACGEADEPEGKIESSLQPEASEADFAAFKAEHVRFSTTLGRFVVEDDMTFSTEDEVRDYFRTSRTESSALTSEVNASVVSKWDYATKRNLTYCVSTAFGTNQAAVRTAMQAATSAWENFADVRYVYRGDQDSNCVNTNQNVVFNVVPTTPGVEFQETGGALSFWPHEARSKREIFINFDGVNANPPRTIIGILTHEIGHTLGFRHEHIHGSTSGDCAELGDSTWLQQTPYDGLSVMHYPHCPGSTNPRDLSISQFDIHGVSKVYDAPTQVISAGGSLYARRMSDGYLFKRTGSTWTQVTNQLGVGFRMHSFVGTSAGMFMLRMGSNAVDFCPASSTTQLVCTNIGGKVGQIFPCPGNTICVTTPDTGDLLRYNGTPNNWTKIGGPGKRFVSNGTRLYAISPGGQEIYTFTPSDNFWRRRLGPSSELQNLYPNSGTEDFSYVHANASLYRFFPSPSSTTEPYNRAQFGTGSAAQFESGGPNLLSIPLEHNQVRKFNFSTGFWSQLVTGGIQRMHRANGKLFLTDTAFNIYDVTEGSPATVTGLGQP